MSQPFIFQVVEVYTIVLPHTPPLRDAIKNAFDLPRCSLLIGRFYCLKSLYVCQVDAVLSHLPPVLCGQVAGRERELPGVQGRLSPTGRETGAGRRSQEVQKTLLVGWLSFDSSSAWLDSELHTLIFCFGLTYHVRNYGVSIIIAQAAHNDNVFMMCILLVMLLTVLLHCSVTFLS